MLFAGLVVLGYLLGSCAWGVWLVRLFKKEDVRNVGSGNTGASNVWRTYGSRLGVPVILLDVAKGFVPALLGATLVSPTAGIAAGAAAMVGHWRPVFLRFEKGGKMIATGGGVFCAIAPLAALSGLGIWMVVFLVFGYASVASLLVALFIPIGAWLYGYQWPVVVFGAIVFVAVLLLHRGNLQRLWAGEETRSGVAVLSRLRPARHDKQLREKAPG